MDTMTAGDAIVKLGQLIGELPAFVAIRALDSTFDADRDAHVVEVADVEALIAFHAGR